MEDAFRSCVTLCAELADADPATSAAVGSPFGPELADLEDGQGGLAGRSSLRRRRLWACSSELLAKRVPETEK